jgi:hypothetical protein
VEAERTGIERDVGFLGLEWDPAMEIGRKLCDSSREIDDKNFKNTS